MGKILLVMYMATCFLFMFSTSACAYIDPSTTTFVIQAVAGVAVAVGAGVVMVWRRMRRKVYNKLGIDENAKKDVESDDVNFTSQK